MKKIIVKVAYNQILDNGSDDDIITFYCPYKKYVASICRDEIENYNLANKIDEEEFHILQNNYFISFNQPLEFSLSVKEVEYKYLFKKQIEYTKEKKDTDLSNIFTWLSWKIANVYNNVEEYNKYISNIDYDGSIDGCEYCEHYSISGYCNRFKTDKLKSNCIFYKFKNIKK